MNITRARRCGLVAAQAGCAASAFAIACSTSDLAGKGHLGLHLAGVGVEHVAGPPGRALDLLAADEMADLTHGCLPGRCAILEHGRGGDGKSAEMTAEHEPLHAAGASRRGRPFP